jgi:hypothetical protein
MFVTAWDARCETGSTAGRRSRVAALAQVHCDASNDVSSSRQKLFPTLLYSSPVVVPSGVIHFEALYNWID